VSSFVHVLDARFFFLHKKKSHYPFVYFKFCARVGRYPKLLGTDQAGEIVSKAMGSRLAAQGTSIDPCPKDEHSKIGSAERAIGELDRMIACSVLDGNLPPAFWDFVGERCSLLNAVTRSCITDDSITIYEAETRMIPDFDLIPPLGCFGFRYLSKLDRKDFKLSPKNQAGGFLGFATLEKGTYGSVLMIGERRFVVAKETVDFIHNNFPLKHAPSANPEYAWMHGLMQGNQAVQKDSLFSDDFGDVDQGIIAALDPGPLQEPVASSQSFSKAAVEGSTSDESDPMDFDNEVAESIAHLDASLHLIHKVDVSSLSRSSCTRLPVSTSMASHDENDGDDGDDENLGLSDDQTADNIALRTRSFHGVRQSSSLLTREKSASIKPNAPSSHLQSFIKLLTENALRTNKTLLIGRRLADESRSTFQITVAAVEKWYHMMSIKICSNSNLPSTATCTT